MFDKRLACTLGAMAAVVAIAVMMVRLDDKDEALPLREPISDIEIDPAQPEEREPEETGPEYAYLLREHEGRIGVFVPGEEEPEMVLDISVRFLPDYDRMLMREGIPARDYNHLVSLIEDYIS